MSEKIRLFFEQNITPGKQKDLFAIKLAFAALLIEMIRMDDEVSENERQTVFNTLKTQFNLDDHRTDELYKLAESELKQTTGYSHFTDLINQHFSYDDKLNMIELLWRTAYSDKQLHRDEAYFVREIGRLLKVSQEDFDVCRNRVRKDVI